VGSTGLTGGTGSSGATGSHGDTGNTGATGAIGFTGTVGHNIFAFIVIFFEPSDLLLFFTYISRAKNG